jgi:hypothetical protein
LTVLGAEHETGEGVGDAPLGTGRVRHPNVGLVDPLWVSEDCTGLTAIYAVLNGITLALAHRHRFTAREVHGLMAAGLRYFEGRLLLRQCVMSGIRGHHWPGLVAGMSEATHQLIGHRVLVERIPLERACDRAAAFDALAEAVEKLRVPLSALRGGVYTAASGVTASSILLFDSRGYSWISKHACGVPGEAMGCCHMILPASLMALNI